MAIKTHSTLLALLLGGALATGAALAQDSTEAPADEAATEEAAPAPATTDATATDADPATDPAAAPAADSTAAAGPEIGSFYTRATHGDWQLRCIHAPDGQDPCEMFQLLLDQSGNAVAEATLIPISDEQVQAGMTITAPLETDLSSGVGLRIDTGEARAYPFIVCVEVGCVSRIGLTGPELDALRQGARGTVYVQPFGMGPDSQVELPMSLTGFTAGFAALTDYVATLDAAPPETPAAD